MTARSNRSQLIEHGQRQLKRAHLPLRRIAFTAVLLQQSPASTASAAAAAALSVSHHAEGASTQATSLAAEASKNAVAFAAQAVHFSNKAAEFVEMARK